MKNYFNNHFQYTPLGDAGGNMFYGASNLIFERAAELRNRMTPAEEMLWNAIHINEWKLKFRRQHPIANYVVDFYCHAKKLVIELDGSIHDVEEVKRNDEYREANLKELGLNVIRFKNEEVLMNLPNVIEKISAVVNAPTSTPLGDGGKDRDKLFVIKIGGNVIDNEENLSSFLKQFAELFGTNAHPFRGRGLLVHGGGKIATKIGEQLGIKSNYINGRRITDDATIDLVTMVYGGLVNKKIVAKLQSENCNAIGLTGADANIIPATKRPASPLPPPKEGVLDFGWVGDVNTSELKINNVELIIKSGITPVFAPLTHDGQGHILNTNADTIASSLAVALSKDYDVRLIYCFEKKGVLENVEDENSVIRNIDKEKYRQLLQEQKLFEGIIPKIDNAFAAIDAGVKEVLIGDARDLLENSTDETKGTLIIQ